MKELTIEVTNNCANRCRHCSSCALYKWDLQGLDEEREKEEQIFELSKPEIIAALEQNPEYERIRFSGGEPFLHPILLEFLREAKQRKKYVEVLTSGVYYNANGLPKVLLQCAKPFLDNLRLSLYGSAKIHNKVTGDDEAYGCLDETISRIIEQQIPFSFMFLATQTCKDGLEDVFSYAAKRKRQADYCKPDIKILRFIHQGNGNHADNLALSREELDEMQLDAEELSKGQGVDVSFGCSFAEKGCRAGNGKAVLTYKGEYIACSSLKGYLGEVEPGKFPCRDRW